jgi:predicted nucleic acid-binding Zn ribbon protein
MSRKSEVSNLKEAINSYVNHLGFQEKMIEAQSRNVWKEVMGKTIASHTSDVTFRDGIMHVYVKSAALRNKLFYEKAKILALMNEKFDSEVIKEVIIR